MPVFTIKKLNSHTDLSKFDCSKDDELGLNGFIHKEALKYQQNGEGVTHLFYRNNKIVGFVTLAMGSIRKDKIAVSLVDYDKVNVPAMLLGRLAVDNSERDKGVGTYLLEYCVGFAVKLAKNTVGCRFVTLVTTKGSRASFYAKHGFKKVDGVPLRKDLEMMQFDLFA
jgi:predicted GNAT family N-acyltransferase